MRRRQCVGICGGINEREMMTTQAMYVYVGD